MPSQPRSPGLFFLLVLALSLPFWFVGSVAAWQPLPGVPVSALMFACPGAAAVLLVSRESGLNGAKVFLLRSVDYRRIPSKIWIVPALLVLPGAMVLSYATMHVLDLPLPQAQMNFRSLPFVFGVFLLSGFSQQLVWSGYALD